MGKRVLLVDCDPQGNLAVALGLKPKFTLYHVLLDQQPVQDCIIQARENLDLIASNKTLAVAEQNLVGEMAREGVLKRRLDGVDSQYDYVLVDCGPSWRLLNQMAIVFARELLVPVHMEFLALLGVKQLVEELKLIEQHLRYKPEISLVVPTFYDLRHSRSEQVLKHLQEFFGSTKVALPIRINSKLSECTSFGKTIFEYAPSAKGAVDYQTLAERILTL